jgi:hypothetical protein
VKVIRPVAVTDAILTSSNVPETDYPAWSGASTYDLGDRVIKTSTHRIYESAQNGNVDHDPEDPSLGLWFDIGPTNRWAVFDDVGGTLTAQATSIEFTLEPGAIDALGVLLPIGTNVRVQVIISGLSAYDQTKAVTVGGRRKRVLVFESMPPDDEAEVIITISGTGTVSASAITLGSILDLGETEASPSIGITDYSKRETNEFGQTKIIPRDWAKLMTLRSMIPTDDASMIQEEVADLRAVPAMWIGADEYDCLNVRGFFRNFSIDLALPTISYCSFTIEGLPA